MLFCLHSEVTHAPDGSLHVHRSVLVETSGTNMLSLKWRVDFYVNSYLNFR